MTSSRGSGISAEWHCTSRVGGVQEAVRWLVLRSRAWVGRDDQWPSESAFRWAWRAARQAKGKEWNPAALVTELVHKTYAPHDSTF